MTLKEIRDYLDLYTLVSRKKLLKYVEHLMKHHTLNKNPEFDLILKDMHKPPQMRVYPHFLDEILGYTIPAEEVMEFESVFKLNIKGRGDVFVVKAKSKDSLLGKEVVIDGENYKVRGVELQGYLEVGKHIGLLVSKIAEKETKLYPHFLDEVLEYINSVEKK